MSKKVFSEEDILRLNHLSSQQNDLTDCINADSQKKSLYETDLQKDLIQDDKAMKEIKELTELIWTAKDVLKMICK